ncbi:MAG: protein-disulfide reductase DsbD, partial [Sulfuricella sp.]|nr:protein-disulfide reductase DsbD [Sulfuricella sp.]
ILATFFGFGLLLALTPCVFPMIPILSGIIVGQGHTLTKSRAFGLSLAYVLGMAITYAAAGVAAGLSGTLLSNALQNPWVLGGFALVFVLLALSMFDLYELQMPSFIQSRFTEASNRARGGGLAGIFAMGALSAVIVGPCVAAPLAGALLYIGQTGDVVLGGSALFALALGMGAPLLLVGVSAGALLPRAGAWMQAVKGFFGVLLLGVAIWLISPVIPAAAHMLLWAALLIVSAMYLHALDPLPHPNSGFAKFWKGVGVMVLIAGVSLVIGALSGNRDILQPLSGLRAFSGEAKAAEGAALKFERVKSVAELERRVQQAKGKYVMLDFYADWCVSCKEFERFTFSDAKVQAKLRDAVLLQADVTANSEDDKALLKKFGLFGPPGIIFFDKNGKELSASRVVGYEPPEKFIGSLDAVIR